MKKLLAIITVLAVLMTGAVLTACNGDDPDPGPGSQSTTGGDTTTGGGSSTGEPTPTDFDKNQFILVVSRADGSGTRTAFVDMVKIVDEDGEDNITQEAELQENAAGIVTVVEQNPIAIGYVSFGSLNPNIKALAIEGTAATVENVRNGSYEIQRPFNVVHTGDLSEAAEDFWSFIFSKQGQEFIASKGYIEGIETGAEEYTVSGITGKVVVGGSTSVQPLMDQLVQEYAKIGGTADVEVHGGGSGTGESSTVSGVFDIGMVSRDVATASLTGETLAIDGIAVIVNKANSLSDISVDDLREIYLGNYDKWNEVG